MAIDPKSAVPAVSAAGVTDAGRVRPINEDAFSYQQPADPKEAEQKGMLYIVTDGMGGLNAGDLASEIAIESVTQSYYASTATDTREALEAAINTANERILNEAASRNLREKMGTTIVTLVIKGDSYTVVNAGNSRCYLVRDDTIHQLTVDHSWAAEKQAQGMSLQQIQADPRRNAVTRALGIKPEIRFDFNDGPIEPGDTFLLATDGLTATVSDDTIRDIVRSNPPQAATRRLLQAALDANAPDNIALLVVRVENLPGTPEASPVEPLAAAAGAALAATEAAVAGETAEQATVPAISRRARKSAESTAVLTGTDEPADEDPTPAPTQQRVITSKSKSKTKISNPQVVVVGPADQLPSDEPEAESEAAADEAEAADEARAGVSPWLLFVAVVIVGLLLGLVLRGLFFPEQPPPGSSPAVAGIATATVRLPVTIPGTPTAGNSPVATQPAVVAPAPTQAATVAAQPGTSVPAAPTALPAQPSATPQPAAPANTPVPPPAATNTAVPPAPTNTPVPPPPPTNTPVPPSATNTPAPRTGVAAATSGGGVNIRQQPTVNSALLGTIPNGTTVTILATVQGQALSAGNPNWYQVSYNGITGYVYSNTMRVP